MHFMKIFGRLKSNLLFSHLPHTSIKPKTLITVPTLLYKRDNGRIPKGAEDRGGKKTTEYDGHKVGQNCKIRNLVIFITTLTKSKTKILAGYMARNLRDEICKNSSLYKRDV